MSTYPYYDPKTIGLAFDAYLETLKSAPARSVFLIHACAHNPTGVDPTPEQWKEISDIIQEKSLFPFFDMAYQGFASGSTSRDAFAVRHFVSEGHQVALSQSFARTWVCTASVSARSRSSLPTPRSGRALTAS